MLQIKVILAFNDPQHRFSKCALRLILPDQVTYAIKQSEAGVILDLWQGGSKYLFSLFVLMLNLLCNH